MANVLHTFSWCAARMFTQNAPASRIIGHVVEPLSGKNPTSGGSSDTDVNEPTTIPAGPEPFAAAVTTQTPVGY
jgi:hypothetical protein